MNHQTPNRWSKTELGELATLQRGFDLPARLREDGEYPIVSSGGITGYHSMYKVKAPGVVTGRYGSVDEVFFVENDFWPLNTTLWVKDFHGNEQKYIYYLLSAIDFTKFSGKTGVPGVNRNDLHKIPLVCPPLEEQKLIIKHLEVWDQAIELTERLIATKRLLRKGLMQQLLTGKRRLPGFREKWQEVSLGKVFEKVQRSIPDGTSPEPLSITAKVGFVSQREKFSKVIAGKNLKKYVLLYRGEFSYNKGNSISYPQGCVFRLKEFDEGAVPNVFYSFRAASSDVYADFFSHYFAAGGLNHQLSRVINTGVRNDGLLNLNASDFFAIKIPLPPVEEQKKIAEILTVAKKEIEVLQIKVDALREQKKGLMQQLLTGKKRVKV